MGGKTATTTQQVQIPREVLERYASVNRRAEQVAEQPFQQYGGQFVAPLTGTQQAGIGAIQQAAGAAQPYYEAAAGLTAAGAGQARPGELETQRYMNPFTQNVVDATRRGLEQQQGMQLAEQQAAAIRGGAFGGDRAGIQRAVLQGQQGLATAQALAPLYQRNFEQALQTSQQQQGVGLQAEQANLQRQLAAGAQFGQLGSGAQQAGLAGAQALLGAGTLEQQTQQADLTARYQQFLQERGYPFQVAQFLANIAMGTGALSGSTTTTTQPAPFFSDEREKTNIKPLGKGLYAYDYIDDVERARETGEPMPPKRVGPMAQDIEARRPGLVVDVNDYKVVDPSRDSMGGAVTAPGNYARGGYADGGLAEILAQQKAMFGGLAGGQGAPGGVPYGGLPGIPVGQTPQRDLMVAKTMPARPPGLAEAAKTGSDMTNLVRGAAQAWENRPKWMQTGKPSGTEATGPRVINQSGATAAGLNAPRESADVAGGLSSAPVRVGELEDVTRNFAARGGLMPRGYAMGGMPYGGDPTLQGVLEEGEQQVRQLPKPGEPPKTPGGLGSDLMDAAKLGTSLYSMGSTAASAAAAVPEALTALMAFLPFSDARLKRNIDPIGETYDGQQIYRYDMGDGRTQLGLMAQEVMRRKPDAVGERNGFLTLDYDRATEDAVPRAYGGLVPRQGYATDGTVSPDGGPSLEEYMALLPTPTPEEVYPYAREAAQKRGLNPNIVERVIRGEWGSGRNYSGDEGSSHGPMQLHYGNVAPGKLSGKGLGDDFTQRTGLDARKPETWPQQIDFGLDRMKELGLTPWRTTMGKLGLGRWAAHGDEAPAAEPARATTPAKPAGLAGGEASRRMNVDAGESPFSYFAGKVMPENIEPGTRSALTSENFWIPILSGLGSMLASKSPYLLGAVGEGLVGGTGAYMSQQKQAADILKQRFDLAKNVFSGPHFVEGKGLVWRDMRDGSILTQEQYQQRMNQFMRGTPAGAMPGSAPVEMAKRVLTEERPAVPVPRTRAEAPATPPATQPNAPATVAQTEQAAPTQVAAPAPAGAPPAPITPTAVSADALTGPLPTVAELEQRALQRPELFRNYPDVLNPIKINAELTKLAAEIARNERNAEGAQNAGVPEQAKRYSDQAASLRADYQQKQAIMKEQLAKATELDRETLKQIAEARGKLAMLPEQKRLELVAEVQRAKTLNPIALQKLIDEKLAEAGIAQRGREFVDTVTGTKYIIPIQEGPMPTPPAPAPAEREIVPPSRTKAEIDPNTGAVIPGIPVPPKGGGTIVPSLPPGARVTELGKAAQEQLALDKQFQEDTLTKAQALSTGIQRLNALTNAFKLFESGSTASKLAGWAAFAKSYGMEDISRKIMSGDPEGVQWVEKVGPNLVLDTLKAATPRFAQQEFTQLLDKGTPEPNKLPRTNFQMVSEALANLNRSKAFIDSWQNAQDAGWKSQSAYWQSWSRANPLSKFEESAQRQMGNFEGMPIPPIDKWATGAVYVVPRQLSRAENERLGRVGLKSGDIFRYDGAGKITKMDREQLYSTHMGE